MSSSTDIRQNLLNEFANFVAVRMWLHFSQQQENPTESKKTDIQAFNALMLGKFNAQTNWLVEAMNDQNQIEEIKKACGGTLPDLELARSNYIKGLKDFEENVLGQFLKDLTK